MRLIIAGVLIASCSTASATFTPWCTGPSCSAEERVWTEDEVTHAATPLPQNPMPKASQRMLSIWQPQHAIVGFVVDTTGAVERGTLRITAASDIDWERALYEAIPRWKFQPADRDGRKVRQLVEEPIEWKPGS